LIIFNYLARQVVGSMFAVTLVLLLIFMSGRFIKYLSQAAVGNISPDILASVMAYRLPGFLELILPLALFMGVLLAYGRMYLESEMTVLHACGYSRSRLAWHTFIVAAAVSVAVGMMSLYVSPQGMQRVETLFAEEAKKTEFEMLSPGRFQTLSGGERVTYAGRLSDDKRVMFDVFISESGDEGEATNVIYAESGVQTIDPQTGRRFLVLQNGRQYQGIPGSAAFKELAFETYGVLISEAEAEIRKVKEEAIPTSALIESSDPVSRSILSWRVSLVVLVPIVTLLAVALCRVNPRQGRYLHLLPAMLLYVLYLGLLILAKKKSAEGEVDPIFAFGVVHIGFLALGLLMFNKEALLARFKKGASSAANEVATR
jgi:lipopolysaccharide export system permease protein